MKLIDKMKQVLGQERVKADAAPAQEIPQAWLDAAQRETGLLLSRDEVEQARSEERQHDVDVTALREAMLNYLRLDQINAVALQIGAAPSQLFGGKGRQVMGLLKSAEKTNNVPALLTACKTLHPDVEWQKKYQPPATDD